jgi:hypothetical protein
MHPDEKQPGHVHNHVYVNGQEITEATARTAQPLNPEIERRFTYHAPKGNQPARYERIRNLAKDFAYAIEEMCPDSREKSLALTNLEQASMWANASIARNE